MKNLKAILPLLIFLSCTPQTQNPCSCLVIFDEATLMVEEVYAGFKDKVNEKTQASYNQRREKFREIAKSLDNSKACHQMLQNFLDFFGDNHLQAYFLVEADLQNKRIIQVDEKQIDVIKHLHPLLGIWESDDHSYRYGIIPDSLETGSEYAMIVLKHPDNIYEYGTVINEFTGRSMGELLLVHHYDKDFAVSTGIVPYDGHVLDMGTHKVRKVGERNNESKVDDFPNEVVFEKINDSTFYARIPLFNSIEVNLLDSMIISQLDEVLNTPYLIFDIRNNAGGDAGMTDLIKSLIYTDTVLYPGWTNRVSQPLLDKLKKRAEAGIESSIRQYERSLEMGIGYHKANTHYDIRDTVNNHPLKVGVLMNTSCASASEFFIFIADQSEKVTLFGQHSSGTMDYGNTWSFNINCEQVALGIATGRNGWVDFNPIEKAGFQPDVEISSDKDWVEFVLDYWDKKP